MTTFDDLMNSMVFRTESVGDATDEEYVLHVGGVATRFAVQNASSYGGGYVVNEYGPSREAVEWVQERGVFRSLDVAKRKAIEFLVQSPDFKLLTKAPVIKPECGQVWRASSGDARRIDRVGTGHASGRVDLWYSVIRPDGTIGPKRSCFIDAWNRWCKASNAKLAS